MKKLLFALILIALVLSFASCGNKDWLDTTYQFDTAIIELPDGETVKGNVEQWTDFTEGDQLQIKIDGKTYLVHASDVVLISE